MTISNNRNNVGFFTKEEKNDNQDDVYEKKLLESGEYKYNLSFHKNCKELVALNHTTWKAVFEASKVSEISEVSKVSDFGLRLLQYREICDLIKTSRVKAQDILNITNQIKQELLFAGAALIQREFLSIEDLIHPEESSELSSEKYSEYLKKGEAISNLEHFVQNKEDAAKIYKVKTNDDYLELKKELVERHPKIQLLKSEQLLSNDFLNQIPCDSQLMHLLDERFYTLIKAEKMTAKQFLEKPDEYPSYSQSRNHTNRIVDYINQLNPESFDRDFNFEEAIAEYHVSPVNMDDFLKARDAAFKEVDELNKNRLDRGMLVEQVSEKLFKQSKFVFSLFQGRKDHLGFFNEINIGSIYYFQKLERDQSILKHNDLLARAISSCCSRFWKKGIESIQSVLSQGKHSEHTKLKMH